VGGLTSGYISGMRALRSVAERLGALEWLEARRATRILLYLRSLFSIYDVDDMVRLDIPWWTFAATAWLDAFLRARPGAVAFEYGAGASTVWLARRCARVHSVEHDAPWAGTVSRLVASHPNVRLTCVPPEPLDAQGSRYQSRKAGWRHLSFERYVRAIDAVPGAFDVIVVDGRCRRACLEAARPRLADGGVIVFDNTLRRQYRGAITASGLRARVFTGLAPGIPYPEQTTVLAGPA
jgi:Methyltransferase domain